MTAAQIFDLTGKVALVTGASSGLGVRFAEVLAENGAEVVLVARRADRLDAVKAKIEKSGGRALVVEADVRDREAMQRAFDAARRRLRHGTVLVNNAGIVQSKRAVEIAEEEWRRVLATNLDAVFYLGARGGAADARAGKGGAIINIASVLGLSSDNGDVGYATAKAGVIQLTKGAGHRTRVQRHSRQRHRAGLDRHRNQPRLSRERARRGDEAANPDGPLRRGPRPRRAAAAAGVRRRPLHDRRDNRRRRWPGRGADAEFERLLLQMVWRFRRVAQCWQAIERVLDCALPELC